MKTKLSAMGIVVLFLMACGSSVKTDPKAQTTTNQDTNEKFILRAYNSQFLNITPQNTLLPMQVDPTKATVFEKIDLGNGKCALKTSNGKYVTADRSKKSLLFADRDNHGEWETFEIIAVDETKVHIKSSEGMFVCADKSTGDTLVANRTTAGDWETFDLQKQN